ncbi:MAG: DUF3500 domain-containing protein [Gemmataceae bacterium]|nr:DUF3500 domain-containing protein [Gemmataceae bacterium]
MTRQDTPTQEPVSSPTRRARGVRFFPALVALTFVALSLYASGRLAQPTPNPNQPAQAKGAGQKEDDKAQARTARAVAAANTFLDSLDAKQRARVVLAFDSPKKAGWSNLPVSFVPRNGVRLGDLTKAQRDAAMGLLAATLSKGGYQKVLDILDADEQLAQGKGGKGKGGKGGKGKGGLAFGKDNYFLAIFGTPAAEKPWMVQFGGHHLGVNVTVAAKTFVLTPTHTGTQPASFTRDGKTVRPLGGENDRANALLAALDDKQKAQAVLKAKAGNLVLGPGQDGKVLKPQGVKGSSLTPAQQGMLLDLIGEWVSMVPADDAAARMAEIKAKVADTYFAWSGPTAPGSAAYFRVQGPTVVIEYAPQGSTDHLHTVIRDPTNDYGQRLLKR